MVCKSIFRDWLVAIIECICSNANEQLTQTPIFIPRKEIIEFPWDNLKSCTTFTSIPSEFRGHLDELIWEYDYLKDVIPILGVCGPKKCEKRVQIFTQNPDKAESFLIKFPPNTELKLVFVCPWNQNTMNNQSLVEPLASTTPPTPGSHTVEQFLTNHVKESEAQDMCTLLVRMDRRNHFHDMQTITLENKLFTASSVMLAETNRSYEQPRKIVRTCSEETKARLKLKLTKNNNISEESSSEPEVVTISEDDVNNSSTTTEQISPSTSSHDVKNKLSTEDAVDEIPHTEDKKQDSEEVCDKGDPKPVTPKEVRVENKVGNSVDTVHTENGDNSQGEESRDKADPKPLTGKEVRVENKVGNSVDTVDTENAENSKGEESRDKADPMPLKPKEVRVEKKVGNSMETVDSGHGEDSQGEESVTLLSGQNETNEITKHDPLKSRTGEKVTEESTNEKEDGNTAEVEPQANVNADVLANNYINNGSSSAWQVKNNFNLAEESNRIKIRVYLPSEEFQKKIPLDIHIETKLPVDVSPRSSQSGNKDFHMPHDLSQSMEMMNFNLHEKEERYRNKYVHVEANTSSHPFQNERMTTSSRYLDGQEESQTENEIWTSSKTRFASKVYGVGKHKRNRKWEKEHERRSNSTKANKKDEISEILSNSDGPPTERDHNLKGNRKKATTALQKKSNTPDRSQVVPTEGTSKLNRIQGLQHKESPSRKTEKTNNESSKLNNDTQNSNGDDDDEDVSDGVVGDDVNDEEGDEQEQSDIDEETEANYFEESDQFSRREKEMEYENEDSQIEEEEYSDNEEDARTINNDNMESEDLEEEHDNEDNTDGMVSDDNDHKLIPQSTSSPKGENSH